MLHIAFLRVIPAYAVTLVPKEDETTFEAVLESRGRPSTSSSQPQKQHFISMHGVVMTDAHFQKQQKEKGNKKQEEEDKDSDVDNPTEGESDSSSELSDINDENLLQLDKTVNSSLRRREIRAQLPKEKDIEKGMFYVVCYDRPSTYTIGAELRNIPGNRQ